MHQFPVRFKKAVTSNRYIYSEVYTKKISSYSKLLNRCVVADNFLLQKPYLLRELLAAAPNLAAIGLEITVPIRGCARDSLSAFKVCEICVRRDFELVLIML